MTEQKSEKLKIVHLITKLELGGAQVNTIYTYQHLDPAQFEAWLVTGAGGMLTQSVLKKENLIILDTLVREINPLKDFKTYSRLKKLFRKIRPDVVHTHSSKAGILGRLAASAAGVPVIIHSVHGFSFSPYQSLLKRSLFVTAEKMVAAKTDHFVFVSQDDIGIAKKKKLVKNNYSLIRSGFPFERFLVRKPVSSTMLERFNLQESDRVCGIIAPFKQQKGLFHLVEIAARVLAAHQQEKQRSGGAKWDIKFLIAGDGILRPELEKRLKEKNISEHFRLPGFLLDIADVTDLFQIGVSTALWEGLPQSLVQLRLKKKAVLASDIPGNREVIRDGRNGFLIPVDDYETFARKIGELLNDDTLRTQLAEFDEEDFSEWNAEFMVRRQEILYRDCKKAAQAVL